MIFQCFYKSSGNYKYNFQLNITVNMFQLKLLHILQLQRFGAKLKERRVYFRKRSKALSHKIKENLYSELLKTTKVSKVILYIMCICMCFFNTQYFFFFFFSLPQEVMFLATCLLENGTNCVLSKK